MRITDAQVRKLREVMSMGQTIGKAAMKAGMHRNTATKYLKSRAWPSEQKTERAWLTREDPFEEDWPAIVARLEDAPEFEAKTLFEDLLARRPDVYHPGQLRTFQRHVKDWRARFGPAKDLFGSPKVRVARNTRNQRPLLPLPLPEVFPALPLAPVWG